MQEVIYLIITAAGFVVVFSLVWTGVLTLLSRTGGWHGLAHEFPAIGRIGEGGGGKMHRFCSARLSLFVNYNNCLTLIVSERGLYMRTNVFLRFAHSPILIPRSAIIDYAPASGIIFSSTKITLQREKDIEPKVITFYGRGLAATLSEWLDDEA
jgi:hypothetical protein